MSRELVPAKKITEHTRLFYLLILKKARKRSVAWSIYYMLYLVKKCGITDYSLLIVKSNKVALLEI